jgi:multiple sugar transport system substrate-binding protein
VNDHDERLRRNLREALPIPPGLPSPALADRIMGGVAAHPRRLAGWRPRKRTWVPALAAILAFLTVAGGMLVQRPQYAGRVNFVADTTANGTVEFVSSQAQPAPEYRAMNKSVLAGFNGIPDFNSQQTSAADIDRIRYEQSVGTSTVDLVALTDGDLADLQANGALEDLTPLLGRLQRNRQFPQLLLDDARLGTGGTYYIPWLEATYLMVVNRQALRYLPPGADVEHLTYDELIAWGQRMQAATGAKRIGLPADVSHGVRGGLVHRFLQGYAYPSFTGTTLTGFSSPEAVQMWETLRRLWSVTNDQSVTYDSMDDPLATGEVWVAWDHQARLGTALSDPEHFIAVPAPSGPKGLGYMSVVVGLAIPKHAPNRKGAEALIDWLTQPKQQAAAAFTLNFSPVVQSVPLAGPIAAESAVARRYQTGRGSVETLLPELGSQADAFTIVYQDTFTRIVLRDEDIATVLNDEAPRLQRLVDLAKAPCWRPDPRSSGPCQIR